MDKKLEQTGQGTVRSNTSVPRPSSRALLLVDVSNEANTGDEAIYGDAPVPYVPLPENNPPTWQMAKTPSLPKIVSASPHAPEMDGSIFLFAMLLGAGLGVLLAYFTKTDLLEWALIGTIAGGTIAFILYSLFNGAALDLSLSRIFDCWP